MNAESAESTQDWVRTFQRKLYVAAKASATRRFGILYDKVCREDVLLEAWRRVAANGGAAGVDQQTIRWIADEYGVERFLREMREELIAETFDPNMIRRVYIPKPGRSEKRPLGIPTVKDRVAQMAVKLIVEPLFEADFMECSYGFRPQRSAQQAVQRVHHLINHRKWVVDVDLKSYFDTIPHDRLITRIRERVTDPKVMHLIHRWLKAQVLDDEKVTTPERGSPQGGVLSPLLSNIYLHQFDRAWDERDGVLIRYADDFVILCHSEEEALKALARVRELITALGLTVNEEKTAIRHIKDGFDFLGFTFREGVAPKSGRMVRVKVPRKKSVQTFVRKIKDHLSRQCLGFPIADVVTCINLRLQGWANYFRIGNSYSVALALHRKVCEQLRLFMRRKHHRQDHRGYRHWPDSFFTAKGLVYVPTLVR